MPKSVICEGKTTTEAISKGLKELHVSKDKVDIKVLENEEKRSFFSILAPRIVKVELTLKEGAVFSQDSKKEVEEKKVGQEYKKASDDEIKLAQENVEKFLKDFVKNFEEITYSVNRKEDFVTIKLEGKDSSKLIGYRGDILNSLQTILNSIANKGCETKVRITLDIGDYRIKREKSLEELADKIAKTVLKNGKSVTLEPMVAYERKIIHNRLQSSNNVKTYSIGEEPYRKVVIAKK